MKAGLRTINIFDILKLYKLMIKLSNANISVIKTFISDYYGINDMPEDFYVLFSNCLNNNRKELCAALLSRNIYYLISYMKKDNIKDIEDVITPLDYFNLPTKQIRSLVEHIKALDVSNDDIDLKKSIAKEVQWKLRRPCISSDIELTKIAIKMFISIGLDNAVDMLSGKYGIVDYDMIYYLFNNLDTKKSNVTFQEFFFNNKKDPNNNMRMMLEGNIPLLFLNFDYFYNAIDYFIDKLGTRLNVSRVVLLLKERYLSTRIEAPELSGDILDDMLSSYYNRYGITDSESEIIEKNIKAYNSKLKTKTKSSIIKTDIPSEGMYKFELIPLNDPRNLVMGYRAGNCFRINGDAFILFNQFLTNPHMRLLSISTDEYKDFGMVLLMRNGNVLIAQGIELSKRIPDSITGEKLYNAVKKAVCYVMDQMNDKDDEIVASIIGLTNSNTAPYNHNRIPFLVTPLLDNSHNYYNGVDNYQGLLALKDGKSIRDMKSFVPDVRYSDNKRTIYRRSRNTYHDSFEYREVEKILISLRYAMFKVTSLEEMNSYYNELSKKREVYTICSYDWFITVFDDGSINTFVNSDDPEVINEYNHELDKISGIRRNKK